MPWYTVTPPMDGLPWAAILMSSAGRIHTACMVCMTCGRYAVRYEKNFRASTAASAYMYPAVGVVCPAVYGATGVFACE